jgi:alkylation response protein AidB-like acyl-CoA dehydrogenase
MARALSKEKQLLKSSIAKIAREKIAPLAEETDREAKFPWHTVKLLKQYDMFAVDFPEKYDGAEMGLSSACLIVEELAKVCAASSVICCVHELGSTPILLAGNQDQKRKYIPDLASGEKLIAFALTEPGAGSDVSGIETTAVKSGKGYLINGVKTFISHADVADYIIVTAKTDTETQPHKGISMIMVEKGTPGFSIGKHEDKMGVRGSSTVEVIFKDVSVPAENLIGNEGDGFAIAMKTFDITRIPVAAQAVGIAQGAFDAALAFTKERQQFGRPIFANQGIKWMLADMAAELEAARQLTYTAAAMFDDLPKNMDRLPKQAIRFSAMAKLVAAETAMRVTTDAVQLFGGYGFTKDYPVERMMRDAKITQIYEGTSQIQKLVIAQTL